MMSNKYSKNHHRILSFWLLLILLTVAVAPQASNCLRPSIASATRSFFTKSSRRNRTTNKQFVIGATTSSDNSTSGTTTQSMIPVDTSMTNNPTIPTVPTVVEEEDEAMTTTSSKGSRGAQLLSRLSSSSLRRRCIKYIVPSRQMVPELVAESFGTFLLLQLVLGIVLPAVFTQALPGGVWPIGALTGLGITVACAAVSSKCAAHFNPAITWSMCLFRGFGWTKMVPYTLSQLLGASAASALNYFLYAAYIQQFELSHGLVRSSIQGGGLTTAKAFACFFTDPITPFTAFVAETFGAFVLATVVFALTSSENKQVEGLYIPPIIGVTVALIIAVVGPISCASLNPARELGPRLVLHLLGGWSSKVAFHQIGMYLAAPMIGATLGGYFVDNFLYNNKKKNNDGDDNSVLEDIVDGGSAIEMDKKKEE